MKKYRRMLMIALAVGIQLAALGAICRQREAVLDSGATVLMRTAPLDPRDVFRGDYVRLTYEVSIIDESLAEESERETMRKPERRVYLVYDTDARNVLVPRRLTLTKPDAPPFIRGLTRRSWGEGTIGVRYGVEKFFVQQGHGRAIERGRRLEGVRIPLEMEAAVDPASGMTVLKGFRYAELGLDIAVSRPAAAGDGDPLVLTVRMVNAAEDPLAVADPADHRTFRIELRSTATAASGDRLRLDQPPTPPAPFQGGDIKVIAPGAVYETVIDLNSSAYRLMRGDKVIGWRQMQAWETARLVYEAPPPARMPVGGSTARLWQGRLVSRAFSGATLRD
jgi:uncharacterized membrane-anchored protein